MFPLILIAVAVQAPEKPPEDVTIRQVITAHDIARRVTHFNKTLHEASIPGTVLRCNNVVQLSDSDFPTTRTYGAICEIRFATKRREYAICDNEDIADEAGIGQATLGLSYDTSQSWIVNFARNNCT